MTEKVKHTGQCHCGAVTYHVNAPEHLKLIECNCSICSKSSYLHLIVEESEFTLLTGKDKLSCYTFDTHEAKHFFCSICGIKSFYIPRSHPHGISINARCLDESTIKSTVIEPFDGRNWDENIEKLLS